MNFVKNARTNARMGASSRLSRTYCRFESLELEGAFRIPPCVLDNYVTADLINEQVRRHELEKEVAKLRNRLEDGDTNIS